MSRHYTKAPITEAVINLQIGGASPADLSLLEAVAARMPEYPKRTRILGIQMGFSGANSDQPEFHSSHEPIGVRLETSTSSRVLQLQKQMFVFSHMPPYSSWNQFRSEAQNLWTMYRDVLKPQFVSRLAVRVINKLNLPGPMEQLERFSNLLPHLPQKIPVHADTFFMQFQLPQPHITERARALINVASSVQSNWGCEFLLDFDLFTEGQFEPDDDALWSLLDKLSEGKNDLFEACITDETRKLIA